MSEVQVNKIAPATGTTLTIGDSSDTITIPSGVTLNVATGGTLSGNVYSGLLGVQYYTGNSTWTKSTRETAVGGTILYVDVIVLGAGGSGNDTSVNADKGGGAAGGYARKLIDVSAITSSTITIGSGGAGVTGTTGNAGTASSWSDGTNTLTGNGGAAGTTGGNAAGGTATGGDLNVTGGIGIVSDAGNNGGQGGWPFGGLGMGGLTISAASVPSYAFGYGSGSGATESATSGNGGDGIVIVQEYGYKT